MAKINACCSFTVSIAAVALFLSPSVSAQVITVPSGPEQLGNSLPFNFQHMTYLEYIDESQFTSITTPVLFTGIQWRLNRYQGSMPLQSLAHSESVVCRLEISIEWR